MASDVQSLLVAQTWDGLPAPRSDWVKVDLKLRADVLIVGVDAPFHGDEPPRARVGSTAGLWNHEVVELFLLGDDERYLEVELGPHGHYLALELDGPRRVVREHEALDYRVERSGARFFGQARIPVDWLPSGLARLNAYSIHGPSDARQYLAWRGAPGVRPDFHRLETFGALGLPGLRSAEVASPGISGEVEVPAVRLARTRARARA